MTDREVLVEMFARAGIVIGAKYEGAAQNEANPAGFNVYAWDREGPQRGYGSFYASFEFDYDGSLKSMGVWE